MCKLFQQVHHKRRCKEVQWTFENVILILLVSQQETVSSSKSLLSSGLLKLKVPDTKR